MSFAQVGASAVRFRVVLLRMDMKPFDEAVTIFMMVRSNGSAPS